eukprot:CAMPEP_0117649204 /NCGR_PEP_ID=MMETSP0804-20121206/841_1 /TAXON_ID=1074897 /ORGANISM="Tetraselmis astigmatica, Strain CCMP880" /LENGTH=434 /DNA_ID=CAMNT_0005454913 /DNA_START=363 /DNA_END=1668 /DNA_ORIENTATION=+
MCPTGRSTSKLQVVDNTFLQQIQRTLHQETLRKLQLASRADSKDGREIICSEVFADITGELDDRAQACLQTPGVYYFYELLSQFYCENWTEAELVLAKCRTLWGQPYIAPVYALLLHKWLLLYEDAGGVSEHLKHMNVLVQGSRHLFWGDVRGGYHHFFPLYHFMISQVVLDKEGQCLRKQPAEAQQSLLSAVASFVPHYLPPSMMAELMVSFPSPPSELGDTEGSGRDILVGHVVSTLKKINSEPALLCYLKALQVLQGHPQLDLLDDRIKVKLRTELYTLTSSGGPRYPPPAVRAAAAVTLDALFPKGALMRRVVAMPFRLMQPSSWPFSRRAMAAATTVATWAIAVQWWLLRTWAAICGAVAASGLPSSGRPGQSESTPPAAAAPLLPPRHGRQQRQPSRGSAYHLYAQVPLEKPSIGWPAGHPIVCELYI